MTSLNRRQYLAVAGTGVSGGLAGCVGSLEEAISDDSHVLETDGPVSVDWSHALADDAVGRPTVSGTTIAVGGRDGEVTAVDVESHETEWVYDGTPTRDPFPVASNDEYVFVWDVDHVEAIQWENGSVHWQSERVSASMESVRYGSLAVDGTLLYAGVEHPTAFDADTGDLRWENRNLDGRSEPPVFEDDGMYVPTQDGVAVLDRTDGSIVEGSPDGSPLRYQQDELYSMARPSVTDDEVAFQAGDVYVYERGTNDLRWRVEVEGQNHGLVCTDETVFVPSRTELLGLDLQDGSYRTSYDVGTFDIVTTPIVEGDSVYVGCRNDTAEEGKLYAFDTTSRDTNWRVSVDEQLRTEPVFHEGTIYIAGTDHLFALTEET
ncbi:PQQ-like beta-propeller repeat protein [Halobacteria archaeon AArc-m2/3/4]|uniref:PQQ-like beta-propeller repeat protein n=1 Tax=Natronoglomus mannanivorans TaxID=2979990 RepID=A0AAP2YYE7_9EURY|nr:PQQ-like beta-propeller repeat protein [Halobacteria archaeon AArc-xg1-1]MCU4974611.1 PQQ-like beta-propeller repeat protein [Halobacteria archaeon AArc-m2/3/4]